MSDEKKTGLIGPAIFLIIAGAITYGVFQIGSAIPSAGSACGEGTTALAMAQAPIEQQLKSPSTAEFASFSESDVSVVSEAPCRYFVRSHVDAQNGFGAMVRNGFSVEIENAEGGWRTISATLDS